MLLVLASAASISGLKSGAVVVLPPGPHPLLAVTRERFDPPVTIDARRAVISGVRLWDVEGLVFKGGVVEAPGGRNGPGPQGYAVDGKRLKNVVFDGIEAREAMRGMVIGNSDRVTVKNSRFHALRSDGVNMAGVTNIVIEGNQFEDFSPIKATGSRQEGNFVDGDHPDAIQIWTSKVRPFGRDILIRDNRVKADSQGINFFGPQREGYERVRIIGNRVNVRYPAAISLFKCTDCEIRGNHVASMPGARFKANIRVVGSAGRFCGNRIENVRKHSTTGPC